MWAMVDGELQRVAFRFSDTTVSPPVPDKFTAIMQLAPSISPINIVLCSQLAQTLIHSIEFSNGSNLYSTNSVDPIGLIEKLMLKFY
jgi:hypothetical protein